MTLRDRLTVAFENLIRMRLRTTLTVTGVVIAIAAFVSMLSFAAGNQAYITEQFQTLGLFTAMQVYPDRTPERTSIGGARKLDRDALNQLAAIKGVLLAYPYDPFTVRLRSADSSVEVKAQALPSAALKTQTFSRLLAGAAYGDDTSKVAMIGPQLAEQLGLGSGDSALGQTVIINYEVSSIDSGLYYILSDHNETIIGRVARMKLDSLLNRDYRERVLRVEASAAIQRFMNGFLNAKMLVTETLIVCGVLESHEGRRLRIEPLIIPPGVASSLRSKGLSTSPTELMSAFTSGQLLIPGGQSEPGEFTQVTLTLDPSAAYKPIKDSVEALGFTAFSFAEQFDEIRRFFVYVDLILGIIGLIALATASLGIVNTMLMSILERRREIGVLKALGADDRDIRGMFLVESGVIGLLGAALGVLVGWVLTRIASAVAIYFMEREGAPAVELFALPIWLILISLALGVGVSVMAGWYPSARAARVDPVEALRNE